MGIKKQTINIEEYVSGGAKCSNPKIIWDTPICGAIRCEKNNGFIIHVTVPDGCEECFWGTYYCNDYCTDCEPIRIRVCPCEVNSDCEACAECHPVYKICVSKCNDNQFCTDFDTCVECDETHPCTNGKQCVGGKCECPPEKPYLDSNGNCAPCTDESCPEGKVCTPDGCQPPICPSGVWHAGKKKCVECINTGDCAGKQNECCQPDNTCDCCPGFVRNPITKLCEKAPCTEDGDCPPCYYCQTGVGCVPQICPDDQICVPGQGCVDICNCTNPNCTDKSAACVAFNAETCYCKSCSGSCANGQPCGEGCFCDPVDLQCKPNPCSNVPCTDGSECGQGCGCNKQTKRCEPCSTADCGDECNNLLGCHCPSGTNCIDVTGCGQPCDGFGSCPPGCACDGGICKPCADFSCDTDACSGHPECKCNSGKCEGDPNFCKDTFIKDDFDCGVEAQLTLNDGCMCPGITAYVTPFAIIKDVPFFNSRPAKYLVSLAVRLAKGVSDTWPGITQLHLLDETQYENIADNDTPLSGSIDVTIKEFYQPQSWVSGAWVNSGPVASRVLTAGGSISFAGIARKENIQFTAHKIGIGFDIIDGVSQKKAVRYEISTKVNQLSFVNNCVYQAKELSTIQLDAGAFKQTTDALDSTTLQAYWDKFIRPDLGNYDLGIKFFESENVASKSRRNPLFTWYRSEDNVYTKEDIIRKLYITPDVANGKVFTDTLYGPKTFDPKKQDLLSPEGRVFGDMYYKVVTDCGCGEKNLDYGNMKWCSPESMVLGNIVFSQCNKKIEIKSDIAEPCPTNWDLNSFTLHADDNTTAFKGRHQAKYHLIIDLENGDHFDLPYIYKEVGNVGGLYHETNNTPIRTFTNTYTSAIVGLRLELRYGTSTEVVCDWVKEVPAPADFTPQYTTTCLANGKIAYRFLTTPNHIVNITAVGGTVSSGVGYKEIVANVGTEVSAYITFTDYCPTTITLNGNCCDTLGVTIQRVDSPVSGVTDLTATITGGTSPFSVSYYRQTNDGGRDLVGESSNSATSYKVVLVNATPGLYIGEVTDANGCVRESAVISIDPRDAGDYPVNITPKFNGCAYTGNVGISIPTPTDVIGGKIFYRIDSGSEQSFTITNSMYSAGENQIPATGHTVTLIRLEVNNSAGPATVFPLEGSATVPTNLNSAIPSVTGFTLNGSTSAINVCNGDNVLIELQGSANAIVQIDGLAPINLDGSGYGASLQTPTESRVYTITGVTSSDGQCTGSNGVGQARQATVLVVPAIEIVSDVCSGDRDFRTITFSNITSATDQNGNSLTVSGSMVTVQVGVVTEIHAVYTVGNCSSSLVHTILQCGAPTITGTVSGPDVICQGESATVTVSGVTGGTAPYYYNYYTNANFNDIYTLNETSKTFLLVATDTVYVRVKDANGNVSAIGSKTITVATAPSPDIIDAGLNTSGVNEVSDNVFEIWNTLDTVVFKTSQNYATYGWLVTGTYGGATTGSNSTFSIDVSQITGTIQLQVTVTTANGCSGSETVSISTVSGDNILESDELLFTTASYKLYKVAVSPSAIDIPVLLCGAGNPAVSVAMRGNGDLITANNNDLYKINVLGGCGATLLGSVGHSNALGMLTADIVVSFKTDLLCTYNLLTNTANNSYYPIVDAPNSYLPTGDIQRVGSYLYGLCRQYVSGVGGNKKLVRFTLNGSNIVTAFDVIGDLPNQSGNPYGLAYVGGVAYLVFSDGKVYNLNLTTPASSTLIGTIVVPSGEPIFDVTNNF